MHKFYMQLMDKESPEKYFCRKGWTGAGARDDHDVCNIVASPLQEESFVQLVPHEGEGDQIVPLKRPAAAPLRRPAAVQLKKPAAAPLKRPAAGGLVCKRPASSIA